MQASADSPSSTRHSHLAYGVDGYLLKPLRPFLLRNPRLTHEDHLSNPSPTLPELCPALDPDLLTIQIRRGVLGLSLLQVMAEAMKAHCAPVRDAMVDDTVRGMYSATVLDFKV